MRAHVHAWADRTAYARVRVRVDRIDRDCVHGIARTRSDVS